MPQIVQAVLNSEEFGNMNGALQNAALQLGMYHGCQRTHQAYPEQLKDCAIVVQDDDLERVLMERFAQLVTRDYAPMGALAAGLMDLERLKKFLSNGEGDHAGGSGIVGESVMGSGDRKEEPCDSGDGKKVTLEGGQTDGGGPNASGDGEGLKIGGAEGSKDEEGKVLEPDDVLV